MILECDQMHYMQLMMHKTRWSKRRHYHCIPRVETQNKFEKKVEFEKKMQVEKKVEVRVVPCAKVVAIVLPNNLSTRHTIFR